METFYVPYRRMSPSPPNAASPPGSIVPDQSDFKKEDQIELIVKYSNDISRIAVDLQAEVEILLQGYAILTVNARQIPTLYTYPQIESIELPKVLYTGSAFNLISSCIRDAQDSKLYNLSGRGVIVAIIDSGIDYTHPDFRNADGSSRILYLWDQSESGTPPAGFSSGAEYSQARLNEALASPAPLESVPSMDFNGHGTAVAGIAAGNGRASSGITIGAAPDAELIVVKVGTKGYRSFARATELMRAVKYVIDKARQLNKPVAINMSFGMNNGSHRGDSIFETYLSQICSEWKSSIVIPTGNEGAAAHHYAGKILPNQTKDVEFFTASGITAFYISMWKNFSDTMFVELISPTGDSSGIIGIENQVKNVRIKNLMMTILYGQPSHYSSNQEIYFYVKALSETIGSGLWRLRIISSTVANGDFELWLPTVEEVTARTQFTNPSNFNTMTIPSTAQKVIAVAGYNDRVGNIAEFSGMGSENIELPVPDLAAPAIGILAPKVGGGYDAFSGTSMAAPFVTGSAALMMEWGIVKWNDPFLYGERIKAFLRLGATRTDGAIYPTPAFGYGTLCLDHTLSYLERYYWGGDPIWTRA